MHINKWLSAEGLYGSVHKRFSSLNDRYNKGNKIKTVDCLMSGLALFALKSPSLLQFDSRFRGSLGHNPQVPSDTYMRERLDEIDPSDIQPAFKTLFHLVQRSKQLTRFCLFEGHYLLSLDGTGYFSSHDVHCDHCCVKTHKDGKKTYYHQMLGGVLVHPDEPTVLPFAPEAMLKQDGTKKNDCERNASKRMLSRIRKDHPQLKLIVVADGLASNAPHIRHLQSLHMRFILGVKPGDHAALFDWVKHHDEVSCLSAQEGSGKKLITREYRWLHQVPLNDSHPDLLVNYLECKETKAGKTTTFTWITDLPITKENVATITKGARARWKIENETFNTLKNQGYQFEHNFGHGKQHLSTVFANLMFLSFMIDQIQQMACKRFQAALAACVNTKRRLWQKISGIFELCIIPSWQALFDVIIHKKLLPIPPP